MSVRAPLIPITWQSPMLLAVDFDGDVHIQYSNRASFARHVLDDARGLWWGRASRIIVSDGNGGVWTYDLMRGETAVGTQ